MSDPDGILASPFTTITATPPPRALAQIVALVREYAVDRVVIGLPLTMRGDIGPQAQVIQEFAAALEAALLAAHAEAELPTRQPVPVLLFDERLTSVVAEQMMRDLGIKPEKRKARIDEIAASIILQDYLDAQAANIAAESEEP
jgi:putative Holliday junction resolvase